MSVLDITPGQIVYSKAGRDAGKQFVVIGIIDDTYVLISDGDLRRIEKPKKKKIKHLKLTDIIIQNLNQKLADKTRVTNSEIRKALAAMDGEQQTDK